jgi:peptide deformylase
MLLSIRKYPDPILEKKAEKVENLNGEVKELIRQMKEVMMAADGAGLAAPQIGVSKRIIIVNTKKGPKAFINPEVISFGKRRKENQEGCLSFPGLWLKITRPQEAIISATNEEGKEVVIEVRDMLALIFQHEIDHINGIEFIRRAPIVERIKAYKVLSKLRREYGSNK